MNDHQEPFPSLKWMWALRDAEIASQLKTLGFALMSFANEKGEMRPTQEQLALLVADEETGRTLSTKTIQRRRGRLEALGWIQRVEKGNGRGRASVYRLSFPLENADTQPAETRTETRTPTPPRNPDRGVRPSETSSDNFFYTGERVTAKGELELKQVHPRPLAGTYEPTATTSVVGGFPTTSAGTYPASPLAAQPTAEELARVVREWCQVFRAYYKREPVASDVGERSMEWLRVDTLRLRDMSELPWVRAEA